MRVRDIELNLTYCQQSMREAILDCIIHRCALPNRLPRVVLRYLTLSRLWLDKVELERAELR